MEEQVKEQVKEAETKMQAQIDTLKSSDPLDPFGFGLSAGTACDDLGAATDQQQQQQSDQHAATNNTH